jgi:hypothetical protein
MKARRPTYANVTATLALVLALAGGAYAIKFPRNSVKSKQIAPKAVKTGDIANAAVTSPKLADGAVLGPKLADSAVLGPKLADGAVNSAKVLDGVLLAQDITAGQIAVGASAGGTAPPAFGATFPITNVPITLQRSGPLLVFGWADAGLTCGSACTDTYGLYVDGAPVAGTGATVALAGAGTIREQLTLFGVSAPVAAGAHSVQLAFTQSAGTNASSQGFDVKVAAVQLGP